jgi:hypothetical protein
LTINLEYPIVNTEMETWDPERLEQNLVAATLTAADETVGFMVGFMTLGTATVEVGHHSTQSLIDVMPVMDEEDDGPEPKRPEPLLWPMPAYPKSLGSIALGADGMVHAEQQQFSLAA